MREWRVVYKDLIVHGVSTSTLLGRKLKFFDKDYLDIYVVIIHFFVTSSDCLICARVSVNVLSDAVAGRFGPDLYRILKGFLLALTAGGGTFTEDPISAFTGAFSDGGMMLVLRKPEAGFSTFLGVGKFATCDHHSTFC